LFLEPLNYHKTFNVNNRGRDYFVGDIQGHFKELTSKLSSIGFDHEQGDRLFSLGDILNKGEDSKACIELLTNKWFHAVMGNHEELFLTYNEDPRIREKFFNAGGEWVKQYDNAPSELKYLKAMVQYWTYFAFTVLTDKGSIGVVHGQSPSNWLNLTENKLSERERAECIWSNEKFEQDPSRLSRVEGVDLVVHGHANCQEVTVKQNQIWIDTIKRTGSLTILNSDQLFDLMESSNES